MAKIWDEKLNNLSVKLDDLSKKAAEAADDARAYHELMQEAIDEKISTVKGNVAAMRENARLAGEERQGKIHSEILKIRMTAKAKAEDFNAGPVPRAAGGRDGGGIAVKALPAQIGHQVSPAHAQYGIR